MASSSRLGLNIAAEKSGCQPRLPTIKVSKRYNKAKKAIQTGAIFTRKNCNWPPMGTMLRRTLKLKEVLNKQILLASVPEAAVLI